MHNRAKRSYAGYLMGGTGLAILLAIGAPDMVQAQESASDVTEVVVVGTRASLQSAMNRKKRADTVVDSIIADDVGQFPDKNVGEALSRVTGVQLSRDFGEGTQVSIRGVEPDLNRVEINGQSVLSAGETGGRGADFRELQTELIQSIDVFKGFTADMVEGGIGGTVSIRTRKPLDFQKPTYSGTVSYQKQSQQDGWSPRLSFLATRKFFDNRLGVLFNFTSDDVFTRSDQARNTEWVRLADWDGSAEKTVVDPNFASTATKADCNGTAACLQQWWDYSPRIPRYLMWEREDKRRSGELNVHYRFNEQWDIWAAYQRNERKQKLYDYNLVTDFTAAGRVDPTSVVTDGAHNVIGFTYASTLANSLSSEARDFRLDIDSNYWSAGVNYNGDRLRVEFLATKADSFYDSHTNRAYYNESVPGLSVQLDPNDGTPKIIFPVGYDLNAGQNLSALRLEYRPSESEITEQQFKLDFDYRLDRGPFTTIEWGARVNEYESYRYTGGGYLLRVAENGVPALTIPTLNINQNVTVSSTATGNSYAPGTGVNAYHGNYVWTPTFAQDVFDAIKRRTPGSFFSGYGDVGDVPGYWTFPDVNTLAQYLDVSNFNKSELREAVGSDGNLYEQIPAYDVSEKTEALYLKTGYAFRLAGLDVSGNIGVRHIKTKTTAGGVYTYRERRATPTATNPDQYTDVTVSNSTAYVEREYSDTLPSFNLSVWLIPGEAAARFGWAKVMARPRVTDLAPNANCLINTLPAGHPGGNADDNDDCTAGNPALQPFRAQQYDLSFEWYPNRDTQVSLGAFYKDIETFVLARTLVNDVDLFNNGVLYDVQQPINGRGAKTKGIEFTAKTAFTFLPGLWSGLGADVNYTWSSADNVGLYSQLDGAALPFPGLSEHSYNVTLWYEKGPANVRLAYNGRSEWLASAADRSGNPVFRDGADYLDAKIQYRLNSNVAFFAEGKNLTNTAERMTAGSDVRLSELHYPGKRFFIGVNFKN